MVTSSNSLVIHQDDLHAGSAKRATANGLASLDAAGKVPISEVGAVELTTNKDQANGYPGLSAASKIATSQLSTNTASGIAGLDAGSKVAVANLPVNTASGVAGLDANSRVPQANSYLIAPTFGVGKALDTEYQNGSRPRIIIVALWLNNGATTTSKSMVYMATKASAGVAVTDNPTTIIQNFSAAALVASTTIQIVGVKIIPAGYYYKLITSVTGTGQAVVNTWDEIDL